MASARHVTVPPALQAMQVGVGSDAQARLAKVDSVLRLVPFKPAADGGRQLPLPTVPPHGQCVAVLQDRQTVIVEDPAAGPNVPVSSAQRKVRLDLAVTATASNGELSETLCRVALEQWLLQGYNVNIVALGRTCTGKSTAMFGDGRFGTGAVAAEAGFGSIFHAALDRLSAWAGLGTAEPRGMVTIAFGEIV